MAASDPDVAIQGKRGLPTERQRPTTTPLAQDSHDLLIKLEILKHDRRALRPTHPRVQEEADDRRIAARGKVLPLTGLEQPTEFILTQDGRRFLGDLRRLHPRHGVGVQFVLRYGPLEEGLEAAITVVRRLDGFQRPSWSAMKDSTCSRLRPLKVRG
jgi:hypothetical protein